MPIDSHEREERKKEFRDYDKRLNQVIRSQKRDYYHAEFNKHIGNIKNTWKNIKIFLNKHKNKSKYPKIFIYDGKELEDPKDIADGFNKFYTEIGPSLASAINTEGKPSFETYLPRDLP